MFPNVRDPPPGRYNKHFWELARSGKWEPDTLRFVKDGARNMTTFVDIGAWVGPVAIAAADAGYDRVICYEPDPVALVDLRHNTAGMPAVEVNNVAVVPPGDPEWHMDVQEELGNSATRVSSGRAGSASQVAAVTPGDVFRGLKDTPCVVKVDIEGAEYDLVPSLLAALPQGSNLHLSVHPKFRPERDVVGCIRNPLLREFNHVQVVDWAHDLFAVECYGRK
jgi:FkbM family methyltransferase